jgi:hypothetical protein
MPPIVALTDEQLTMVLHAAAPLARDQRGPFLEALAVALQGNPEQLGDGALFRLIRETQRRFWDPPLQTGAGPSHTHRVAKAR